MMCRKDKFNMAYIWDLQTKILELPYVGNELSMIILLPDAIQDGSTGLESVSCWDKCKSVSFWGRKFDIAYRTAVQFQSCYVTGAQHQLKTWPSSATDVSCGYGEGMVGWGAYVVRGVLGKLLGSPIACPIDLLFWTAGRLSLPTSGDTSSQENVGSLLLWRYDSFFFFFFLAISCPRQEFINKVF